LIRDVIAKHGRRCEDPACATPDRARGKRIYGDHIRELKDRGEALDPANIMLRCASCHGKKTATEARKRQPPTRP